MEEEYVPLTDAEIFAMERDQECLEYREAKVYALQAWLDMYHEIETHGFIGTPVAEDYRAVPVCVRRKTGEPIDAVATRMGYSYVDEFVDATARCHAAWKNSTLPFTAWLRTR